MRYMNGARRLILPVIAISILVGIGVGLFMAWRVWPVTWYDTDPSDLRLQHQFSWVIMASDSLAVTGDVDLTRQRLFALTDEQTDWQWVANLVEQAAVNRDRAEDTAAALRLRRMAQALVLPQPTAEEVAVRPPASVIPPGMSNGGLVAGSIVAVFIGLVLIVWLALMIMGGSMATEPMPPYHDTPRPRYRASAPRVDEPVVEVPLERQRRASPPPAPSPGVAARAARPVDEADVLASDPLADQPPVDQERDRPRVIHTAASPRQPMPPLPANAIARFEAEYQYGDDHLDVSHSIERSPGQFLGECGLSVADVLDADEFQQIDAFEVWLYDRREDRSDSATVSKYIVSDMVLRDEGRRQELREEHELVLARRGALIELQTRWLRLEAQIIAYRYRADDDASDAVFDFLEIELIVFESEDG
jgi:hypothetical protein